MGGLKMRTFLANMPECKLGLIDKVDALYPTPDIVTLPLRRQMVRDVLKMPTTLFCLPCAGWGPDTCWYNILIPFCLAQVLFDNQGRSTKNKSVDLEDIKFHQCVRLTRFENDRTISFIPPDGNFDLMCVTHLPAGTQCPAWTCCERIHHIAVYFLAPFCWVKSTEGCL